MIITKTVKILVNNRSVKHYRELGYVFEKGGIELEVKVEHLPKRTSTRIDVQCDLCGSEHNLSMQKYTMNVERHNFYSCKACNNEALKLSCLDKYGVDNVAKSEEIQQKKIETSLERYGVPYHITSDQVREKTIETMNERYGGHWMKLDEFKYKGTDKMINTRVKNGTYTDPDKLDEWDLYRRRVKSLTKRNRPKLLEEWDGLDYYDGEYIKDNFELEHINRDFPTLDHKTSVYYGFMNGIDPEIISHIDNLCFTKRYINCIKHQRTEEEYKQKIEDGLNDTSPI